MVVYNIFLISAGLLAMFIGADTVVKMTGIFLFCTGVFMQAINDLKLSERLHDIEARLNSLIKKEDNLK